MGPYDTGDLYRRQHTDEAGPAVLGSSARHSSTQRRRAFLVPPGGARPENPVGDVGSAARAGHGPDHWWGDGTGGDRGL